MGYTSYKQNHRVTERIETLEERPHSYIKKESKFKMYLSNISKEKKNITVDVFNQKSTFLLKCYFLT